MGLSFDSSGGACLDFDSSVSEPSDDESVDDSWSSVDSLPDVEDDRSVGEENTFSGYRFVDMQMLEKLLIYAASCKHCNGQLSLLEVDRKGIAPDHELALCCSHFRLRKSCQPNVGDSLKSTGGQYLLPDLQD